MKDANEIEPNDIQGLLRFGYGWLPDTCFMLLDIADMDAAKQWLKKAPVNNAVKKTREEAPDTVLQIAFSVEGLRVLGLRESIIEGFSDDFITGMAGDEARSRRLGDMGTNTPKNWVWGGNPGQVPHVLMLLYSQKGLMAEWRAAVEGEAFSLAFRLRQVLPTNDIGKIEPFGFVDGISQPEIDWNQRQSKDEHDRDRYSNLVAPGEFILGYPNEYGLYTARPLIEPQEDGRASELPNAYDEPRLKVFGRNGTYLVIRQLHQDVPGFWQFVDKAAGPNKERREQLAASIVGRQRDGLPLVPPTMEHIAGIEPKDRDNHFTYEQDPTGHRCPVGAHIRRSNPRTGDLPHGSTCRITRLFKMLGFKLNRPEEDLIASTRFHRLLRRGRAYGDALSPDDAINPDAPAGERGLQFVVLAGNILRQFECIMNAWTMSSKFGGVQQERDPLLGVREPLLNGEATDHFHQPDPSGPMHKFCGLPQFVTVLGGGYFFIPGLRALQYIATTPHSESVRPPGK